ncbi:MAG: class I SAM-dependent methyltransferase [Pseudomonadota bacterium]
MASTDKQMIPVLKSSLGSWHLRVERLPFTPERLAYKYDRLAPDWATVTERFGYDAAYRRLFKAFLKGPGRDIGRAPARVLDVGIGAGAFSLALLDSMSSAVELTGVDLSAAMLQEALARLAERKVQADLYQSDIRSLPFESAHFDVVISAHVLEHLTEPVAALKEIRRVLRPGGWLVICLTRQSWLGTYIHARWRTHRVSIAQIERWLEASDLEAEKHQLQPGGIFDRTSLVALGRCLPSNCEKRR